MEDLIRRSDAIKVVRHISMEFITADGRQELIEAIPSADTKQIKYYDEDENVWKVGEVIVDETD